MAEEKQAFVKLGYKIDQSSVNAVDKAVVATESRLASLQKSTAGVGEAAAKTGSVLKEAFNRSESAIKADQKAVDDLRKSLDAAADEAEKVGKAGSVGGSGLQRTGRALTGLGLGSVGEVFNVADDIQDLTEGFTQLGGSVKGLPGILGAVSAAAGPIAVAFSAASIGAKVFADGLAAADAEIKRSSDQISAYYQIIKDGTTESINAQIKKLEADKAINDAELKYREANLKAMQDQEHEAAQQYSTIDEGIKAFFKELGVELEQAGLRAGPLTEKIKELKDKSADAQAQIEAYKKALGDSGVAANDAAEAEKKLTAERLKGIDQAIKDETQRAKLLRTGTSTQVEGMIADNQDEIKGIEARLPALQEEAKKSKEGAEALKAYQDRLAQLKKQQDDLTNNVLPLIKAREGEKRGIDAISKGIDERIKNEQKYADLTQGGSSKDVQNRIDAIEREKETVRAAIETFDQLGQTNEDARRKADEYRQQLDKLNEEEGRLTSQILPLIEAREAEARVIEVQRKYAEAAAQIETRDAEARASALQKKTDSLTDIERKSLESRADIQKKYNQNLVDLARKGAEEAADALRQLAQQRADLGLSLIRDEQKSDREAADKALELRIKAAREDERANREHYQRLEDIRRAAQDREADLILNRDFLGLFQSRRQTTRDLESENTSFVNKQTESSIARQQEADDERRAIETQRRERIIAYQAQLQDLQTNFQREREQQAINRARQEAEAQISYAREIEQQRVAKQRQITELNISYQREINALNTKTANERATLARAYDQELSLAASYGKARVDNERKVQEALLAQAKSRLAALNGGSTGPVMRADGGGLAAGQTSFVNEPVRSSGRETFSSAAGTLVFPGFGLFRPLAPGVVNANRNSSFKVDMPVTINESRTPQATAGALRPMVYDVLEELTQS